MEKQQIKRSHVSVGRQLIDLMSKITQKEHACDHLEGGEVACIISFPILLIWLQKKPSGEAETAAEPRDRVGEPNDNDSMC